MICTYIIFPLRMEECVGVIIKESRNTITFGTFIFGMVANVVSIGGYILLTQRNDVTISIKEGQFGETEIRSISLVLLHRDAESLDLALETIHRRVIGNDSVGLRVPLSTFNPTILGLLELYRHLSILHRDRIVPYILNGLIHSCNIGV